MVSPSVSGIAGAIFGSLLPPAKDKLISNFMEYLSRDKPSSSEEDKLQQLDNERKAFERANRKLQAMQDAVRRLHERDKKNTWLIEINKELRDVSNEIQDLKDDLKYMEPERKVEESNQLQLQNDEADKSQSKTSKRVCPFSSIPAESSDNKRRRLSSSKYSTDDMVNKMRTIVERINCIDSEMSDQIKWGDLSNEIALKGGCDHSCRLSQAAENKCVTTSSQ